MIGIIAAIDNHQALGANGKLLCHLPLDLRHFKQTTLNQSILMGRKTFESIERALPQRENFVLTRQKDVQLPGCICVTSLDEALARKQHDNLWIIGGGEIYAQCLPFADTMVLTKIHHRFASADVFFPPIIFSQWKIVAEEFHPASEKNDYPLSFITMHRIH